MLSDFYVPVLSERRLIGCGTCLLLFHHGVVNTLLAPRLTSDFVLAEVALETHKNYTNWTNSHKRSCLGKLSQRMYSVAVCGYLEQKSVLRRQCRPC